jgi:proteic killer suppression protein
MIRGFGHGGIEAFLATGARAGIQPHHAARLTRQLKQLDRAKRPEDMNVPGWQLHSLSLDLAGHSSVWGQWQLATDLCPRRRGCGLGRLSGWPPGDTHGTHVQSAAPRRNPQGRHPSGLGSDGDRSGAATRRHTHGLVARPSMVTRRSHRKWRAVSRPGSAPTAAVVRNCGWACSLITIYGSPNRSRHPR